MERENKCILNKKIHENKNLKTQLFSDRMRENKYTNKICVCNAFSINENYFKDPSFHLCLWTCDTHRLRERERESMKFHEKEFMMLYCEKKLMVAVS